MRRLSLASGLAWLATHNMNIGDLVAELSSDSLNPELNFKVAEEYRLLNQTASAVSFYLRVVELGKDTHPLFSYCALIRMSECFSSQNDRNLTVTGALLQAITLIPDAPDAYFLLARAYESMNSWQESYTWAVIGSQIERLRPVGYFQFPVSTGYPGRFCFSYQKAISAFWIGRLVESRRELKILDAIDDIPEEYKNSIKFNLERLNAFI